MGLDDAGVQSLFSEFQKTLDVEHEIREVINHNRTTEIVLLYFTNALFQNIRNICKELDQIAREAVTQLQVIHHKEEAISPACLKVRELFEKTREGYLKLADVVPSKEYYKFQDHWRFITQRYSYLISLTIWLETGIMATHETVAEVLGMNPTEEKEGFHLDIEDYLMGLLLLCTELSRLAVNAVTRGDYNKPMQISKFVMQVNAGFRLLSLKNDHLRKRFDALKYDVKKIEEVVYDLSIRGLLPKTQEPTPAVEAT